jgi:hypothetical protein
MKGSHSKNIFISQKSKALYNKDLEAYLFQFKQFRIKINSDNYNIYDLKMNLVYFVHNTIFYVFLI